MSINQVHSGEDQSFKPENLLSRFREVTCFAVRLFLCHACATGNGACLTNILFSLFCVLNNNFQTVNELFQIKPIKRLFSYSLVNLPISPAYLINSLIKLNVGNGK